MLTRHGWTALVAAGACFAVGRVFGLIELYVLAVGIVIAVLVALISVQRRLPPLNVRRIVSPSFVSVGEPARVDIQIANLGRQASPYLQLWEPVGSNGGAPMQLAKLGPGQAASAAYRVPTVASRLDPYRSAARTDARRARSHGANHHTCGHRRSACRSAHRAVAVPVDRIVGTTRATPANEVVGPDRQ